MASTSTHEGCLTLQQASMAAAKAAQQQLHRQLQVRTGHLLLAIGLGWQACHRDRQGCSGL